MFNHKRLLPIIVTLFAIIASAQCRYACLDVLGESISLGGSDVSGTVWDSYLPEACTVGRMPKQILANDNMLFVSCSGDATIMLLSADGYSISHVRNYSLPTGSNPYLMCIDNNKLYVTLWVHGGIAVIDLESHEVEIVPPFCRGPQGVLAHDGYTYVSAGNFDGVTFEYGAGYVFKLNSENTVIDSIRVGTNPQDIVLTSDGVAHVVCTGDYGTISGTVYFLDLRSFSVTDSLMLGGSPQRLTIDKATGYIYSATSAWGTVGSGKILAYNGLTHEILHNIISSDNITRGTGFDGLAAHNGIVFLPSMDSNWVEILCEGCFGISTIACLPSGYGPLDVCLYGELQITEHSASALRDQLRAYPNPFNSSTTIVVPNGADLQICDASGKIVFSNNNITQKSIIWEPYNEKSGVYYASIIENNRKHTCKLMYLK